jgi:hypothetical protein
MFADICRRFTVIVAVSSYISLALGQQPGAPDASAANAQIQEMQKVEDSWSIAMNKHDQYGLENVLSPMLVDIAATGDVTTRNQDIAKLFSKDTLPLSMTQKVITVRTLADGIVLVSGTYTLRWPESSGSSTQATIDEKGIFTHVFQAVNGHWICVNSQRTVVAEQMPQAKIKASAPKTKSNAAEPFHIPLVYKGAQSTQPPPAPGSQPAPPN